ncbi:MAG: AAA family ATPase [Clostridiales bacterium]|jgi:Holliday junction resolvasome RuvABC ATP-dependent DNA helicase subunit|nr:AAA family ATPase [Clostridiales bacterium]
MKNIFNEIKKFSDIEGVVTKFLDSADANIQIGAAEHKLFVALVAYLFVVAPDDEQNMFMLSELFYSFDVDGQNDTERAIGLLEKEREKNGNFSDDEKQVVKLFREAKLIAESDMKEVAENCKKLLHPIHGDTLKVDNELDIFELADCVLDSMGASFKRLVVSKEVKRAYIISTIYCAFAKKKGYVKTAGEVLDFSVNLSPNNEFYQYFKTWYDDKRFYKEQYEIFENYFNFFQEPGSQKNKEIKSLSWEDLEGKVTEEFPTGEPNKFLSEIISKAQTKKSLKEYDKLNVLFYCKDLKKSKLFDELLMDILHKANFLRGTGKTYFFGSRLAQGLNVGKSFDNDESGRIAIYNYHHLTLTRFYEEITSTTQCLIDNINFGLKKYVFVSGEQKGLDSIFSNFDISCFNVIIDCEDDKPEFIKNLPKLDDLVGLHSFKEQLNSLDALLSLNKRLDGIVNKSDFNLHMIFTGNPGTGKTLSARLVAELLYNMGYIKKNKVVEVGGKDLISQWVGNTSQKTDNVIKSALDGVLFIDEAYSTSGHTTISGNSYSMDFITTMLKAMEDYRDRLVIIFAGYKDEMDGFMKMNPGLQSRIGYTINFEDYTTAELLEILLSRFKEIEFDITEKAIIKAEVLINKASKINNFGNARFIMNLFQYIIVRHSENVIDKTDEALKIIDENDIDDGILDKLGMEKHIGFDEGE